MKIFPNLAGGLRFYFGLARVLAVLFAAFWFLTITFSPWIQKLFADEPKLMVSVGEVAIDVAPSTVGLVSASAQPGSLLVRGVRGSFQADLLSKDAALVSALRWTVFPSVAVFTIFSWMLFGSLRALCANIERREIFSDDNLRLVRNCGLLLIAYSLVRFVLQFGAAHVMDGYFRDAVTVIVNGNGIPGGKGVLHFSVGPFPAEMGLVTGCFVLMLSEAFRQGLALKAENDLTV